LNSRTTKVYTGLHIAAAGLRLGGLGKYIVSQPLAWQPVKLALCASRRIFKLKFRFIACA
jgi:hypothetical protein